MLISGWGRDVQETREAFLLGGRTSQARFSPKDGGKE
jgi:hypothetical protein